MDYASCSLAEAVASSRIAGGSCCSCYHLMQSAGAAGIDISEIMRISKAIVQCAHYLHNEGIIHGDHTCIV